VRTAVGLEAYFFFVWVGNGASILFAVYAVF
jgi:hypothetical protein